MDTLSKHPDVYYIVSRPFTYEGVDYKVGDEFPNTPQVKTEVLVRSNRIVPTTDNVDLIPRYPFRNVVKTRELVYKKLRVEDPREAKRKAEEAKAKAEAKKAEKEKAKAKEEKDNG